MTAALTWEIIVSCFLSVCDDAFRNKRNEERRLKHLQEADMCESFLAQGSSLRELIDQSQSSGSGSGLPLLVGTLQTYTIVH